MKWPVSMSSPLQSCSKCDVEDDDDDEHGQS